MCRPPKELEEIQSRVYLGGYSGRVDVEDGGEDEDRKRCREQWEAGQDTEGISSINN